MIRSKKWSLLMAAVVAVGVCGQAFAEDAKPAAAPAAATASAEPNTLSDKEKADGWKLLFDGKSAEHFRNYGKAEGPISDKWKVKDGALVLTGGGGGDIITKEKFTSYELSLDYKITKGGNSGLMFHVVEAKGKPPYDSGPEVQIQDNVDGHDPQKAGWLYQFYPAATDEKTGKPIDATKPVGEWNTLTLKLDGAKGEITMNGAKYSSFELWSKDWDEKLAKSKFKDWANFAKAKSGHIALQDHGNEVAFRNIKIREIK